MDILLTADFRKGLFTNGLQQNIVFLSKLLQELGHNPMIVVNHSIDECIDPPTGILIMNIDEVYDYNYDYILQTSFTIEADIMSRLKEKSPRFKNIHKYYGNGMLSAIELSLELSDRRMIPINPALVDEVWISPHYEFSKSFYQTYYKTSRVLTIPYIWDSFYVDIHEEIWNKEGKSCKYDPGAPKNIAIAEPNLNFTKNAVPPIFLIEELYSRNPDLIESVNVYCSSRLKEKHYFQQLLNCTKLHKDGKINLLNRHKMSKILSSDCSVLLSHNFMNGLNYTYLEALHFNVPLIHDSTYIQEAGYNYPLFDFQSGARALEKALTLHDENLETYEQKAKNILRKYSPHNPLVIEEYKKLFI
jgi:cyanate lyase